MHISSAPANMTTIVIDGKTHSFHSPMDYYTEREVIRTMKRDGNVFTQRVIGGNGRVMLVFRTRQNNGD